MRRLASISWRAVALFATSWVLLWLVVLAVASGIIVHPLRSSSPNASGGIAAIGIGATTGGVVLFVAPPLILIVLRLFVGAYARNKPR